MESVLENPMPSRYGCVFMHAYIIYTECIGSTVKPHSVTTSLGSGRSHLQLVYCVVCCICIIFLIVIDKQIFLLLFSRISHVSVEVILDLLFIRESFVDSHVTMKSVILMSLDVQCTVEPQLSRPQLFGFLVN